MGRIWGRLYAGTRHHRKIRILRQRFPDSWWIFYPLLEMAFETNDDGLICIDRKLPYTLEELGSEVGLSSTDMLKTTLNEMERLSLIEIDPNGFIRLLSYSDRQFESDSSKERMRKFRQKAVKKNSPDKSEDVTAASHHDSCDVAKSSHNCHGDVTVTPPEQNRTKQNKVHSIECVAFSALPGDEAPSPSYEDSEKVEKATESEPVSSPETEYEHEPENSKKTQPKKRTEEPQLKFTPADLMALWNELGCRPPVIKLTDVRRKKATVRIRQRDDPLWWRELLEKIRGLQAKGRQFLTFDFLIGSENNLLKIIEGNYDADFKGKKHDIAENHQQRAQGEHYYRVRPVEQAQPAGC